MNKDQFATFGCTRKKKRREDPGEIKPEDATMIGYCKIFLKKLAGPYSVNYLHMLMC